MMEDEIRQLREELETLRLLYPVGTADRINFLELEVARLKRLLVEKDNG